ncbi:MAG: cyclic-phosphate processing receiver domain-containing protein [Acidithiobacillus sp.]|jgi:hypothetical protein|uniref:cyclic-phosphate processing receiver domain-containing protein n=1 Tax=Acidithiobacillus sp. TaxID=1872118 RepID=UPI0035610181
MKIFLDDCRNSFDDWIRVFTSTTCIEILKANPNKITEISLDHDLGLIKDNKEETGYDVLLWLEEQVLLGNIHFIPEKIILHTKNPVACIKMFQSCRKIALVCAEYNKIINVVLCPIQ